jgi:hypothetical protein
MSLTDSFLTPGIAANPDAAALADIESNPGDPIFRRQAQNVAAYQSKARDLASILKDYSPETVAALDKLDQDRLSKGQQPLSKAETLRLAVAGESRSNVTPEPERNILNVPGNVIGDLKALGLGLIRLPFELPKEILRLPGIPQAIAENQAAGQNPITAIANAPGIRMLPFSYLVGNLAAGPEGWKELASHPLFTALDVSPIATKLAARTPAAQAATEAYRAATEAGTFAPKIRPIRAALTRTVTEDGTLARNSFGRVTQALTETRGGQFIDQTFGQASRASAREYNLWKFALRQSLMDTGPIPKRLNMATAYVANMREGINASKKWVDEMGPEWVADTTSRMKLGDIADFDSKQLDYMHHYNDVADRLLTIKAAEDIGPKEFDGEWYDEKTASTLFAASNKAKAAAERATIGELLANPDPTTALRGAAEWSRKPLLSREDIAAGTKVRAAKKYQGQVSKGAKRQNVMAYLNAAEAAGISTKSVRDMLQQEYKTSIGKLPKDATPVTWDDISRAIDDLAADPTPNGILSRAELLERLGNSTDANVVKLREAVKAGRWTEAKSRATALSRRKNPPIDTTGLIEAIEAQRQATSQLSKKEFTGNLSKTAQRAQEQLAKTQLENPSQRWQYVIEDRIESAARETILDANPNITPDDLADRMRYFYERRFEKAGLDQEWFDKTRDEIAASWLALREAGLNPVFVPEVAPYRMHTLLYPNVTEVPKTPKSNKAATISYRPEHREAFIALSHDGMEWIQRKASFEAIKWHRDNFGKTRSEIIDMYRSRASNLEALADPRIARAYIDELERLIDKHWTPFDPVEYGYNWDNKQLHQLGNEEWLLPNSIAKNLKKFHEPPISSFAFFDPIMKAFRTSVLALSPNWHLGNVLGNTFETALTNPRGLAKLGQAIQLHRAGNMADKLPEDLMLTMSKEADWASELNYREGLSMSRLIRETTENPRALQMAARAEDGQAMTRAGETFRKVTDASYEFNNKVDRIFRAANYLAEYERLTKLGKNADEARNSAIQLVHQVLPDYLSMTPFEQNVFRRIFPFYPFTQHIMRLTATYPLDHPLRVAIAANVVRAMQQDLGGLPDKYLSIVNVGGRSINLKNYNPFGDVGEKFTLLGFMAGSNPVLKTMFEQMGFKNGEREAYPELRYDPETGRMVAIADSALRSFVYNVIPQTKLVAEGLQLDNPISNRPDAKSQFGAAFSAIRLPQLQELFFRENLAEVAMRNEQSVNRAMLDAASTGLRTGDFSYASRFPALRDWISQVRTMQSQGAFNGPNPQPVPPVPLSADEYNQLVKSGMTPQRAAEAQAHQTVQRDIMSGGI